MTESTDLFTEKPEQTTSQGTPAPTNEPTTTEDPLAGIMGEGRKYATPQDLANAISAKDTFIEQLKRENSEMRADLRTAEEQVTKAKTVDELLSELRQGAEAPGETTDSNQPAIDPAKLLDIIDERVDAVEKSKQARFNREKSNSLMLKLFNGDEVAAKNYLAGEAARLKVSLSRLGEISEESPEAFSRLLNLNSNPNKGPSPVLETQRNSDNLAGDTGNVRNQSYYNAKRKELGNARFMAPEIQNQLMKDAMALGEEYFK